MTERLQYSIEKQFPFISVINRGNEEYVGIVINQDQHVISFYDFNAIKTQEEKALFLELGEAYWWETNRTFPITVFCKDQISKFDYAIKTFNSKDTKIVFGPTVNVSNIAVRRIKRKSIQLIRRVR